MNQTTTLKLFSNIFILRKKGKPEFCNVSKFHFWSKIFLEKSDFDCLNPIFNFFEKKNSRFSNFSSIFTNFSCRKFKIIKFIFKSKMNYWTKIEFLEQWVVFIIFADLKILENTRYAKIHNSVLHENSFFATQLHRRRIQFVNTFAHFLIAQCAKKRYRYKQFFSSPKND